MLIKEALLWAGNYLADFPSRQLESRILLANILSISQEQLLIKYNDEISESDKLNFITNVKRRKRFEPIAYITGHKEFYSINFLVNRDVLIPRPDTENIVDKVIEEINNSSDTQLLELGTGSGAIAVSLAVNLPNICLTATDISLKALEIARRNASLNNVADKITFLQSNWYSDIKIRKFDIIISNPPYISRSDKHYMAHETLLFEPFKALFANNKGLACYEIIISKAPNYLKSQGKIFLEIGFDQANEVKLILEKNNFSDIEIYQDFSGNDRIICGILNI